LNDWLQRPHVHRWWGDTTTLEETIAYYTPALRGEEPTQYFIIVVDGRDAGMIETYRCSDYPEWEAVVQVGEGVAGLDLLIGEEDLIGRGLGPQILCAFVRHHIADSAVVASVDEENPRSWRAFEKAGFRHVRDIEEEGRPHRLMRIG